MEYVSLSFLLDALVKLIPNIFGALRLLSIPAYFFKKKPKSVEEIKNYNIVVVTIGSKKVFPALYEVVSHLKTLALDYVILSSQPLNFKNTIVVPKEKDGSKYRAIKYFVENFARDDEWYIFLDDDSYPLDRKFLKEIKFYAEKGCVAGNGILKPRSGKSKIAYALDWIRYFDDLTRFRLTTEILRKPLLGLHGELLIVKGDILREIWPNMKESITEDFRFAMELVKRGYKTFQVSTNVSIKSPNSLKDFVKQRARWAHVFKDSLEYRNFFPVVFAVSGILVNWLFFPLWFIYGFTLASIASLYYFVAYFYGAYKAKVFPLFVLPLSALEIIGFLKGLFSRANSFIVIDKT